MKKKVINFFPDIIIIALLTYSVLLSLFLWMPNSYSMEIPYKLENKSKKEFQVSMVGITQLEGGKAILNEDENRILPNQEDYFSIPDYDGIKKIHIFFQLKTDGKNVYTYSPQSNAKYSTLAILDNPPRIEEIER